MATDGDDFVVRKSGRKKKACVKQKFLDDSEDSDGEIYTQVWFGVAF